MEIVDELMTPGCPQCAVKHLSAAIMYRAQAFSIGTEAMPSNGLVMLARAYVNLAEVAVGYKSHLWFAVGLLQRAEELATVAKPEAKVAQVARAARLELERRAEQCLLEVLASIDAVVMHWPKAMMFAHLAEAARELPSWTDWSSDYDQVIRKIREEYFVSEEAPAASTEDAEKGGETDMATKKAAKKAPAFLKKEDPKAKKAACKGGKCKKGCK